jgi:DNA-binding XRE family transcriptional regulator
MYRKRTQLTQREVAFLMGAKSSAGICRHENFRQQPTLENMLAYEMLFSTPVRNLFSDVHHNLRAELKERIRALMLRVGKKKQSKVTAQKITLLNALLHGE